MKTYKQFIEETKTKNVNPNNNISNILAQRATGAIGGFARNIIDPRTAPVSDAATSIVRDVIAPRLPRRVQPAVRAAAPIAGIAAGMTKYAPHVSAAIAGLDAGGTAVGRVRTGTYKGTPVYMDK